METTNGSVPADKKLFVARQIVGREGLMRMVLGAISREGLLGQRRFKPLASSVSVINMGGRRLPEGIAGKSLEELDSLLLGDVPSLNDGKHVSVTGVDIFENSHASFVGLELDGVELKTERDAITASLRTLDIGFHTGKLPYKPHVSLAKAQSFEDARLMAKALETHIPDSLDLLQASIELNSIIRRGSPQAADSGV